MSDQTEDTQAREYTTEEVREMVLDHLRSLVDYWESRNKPSREKLEGLVFSILAMLDGETELPAFIVAPDPHPSDKAYHQAEGDQWFPENPEVEVAADISGTLHERFYRKK